MCHLLLLLPLIGLVVFWILPLWIAIPTYGCILVASLLIYAVVIQAMRRRVETGSEGMIGAIGKVIQCANHHAQVSVHGELWSAESSESLHKGQTVQVVGIHGLSIDVERRREFEQSTASTCH